MLRGAARPNLGYMTPHCLQVAVTLRLCAKGAPRFSVLHRKAAQVATRLHTRCGRITMLKLRGRPSGQGQLPIKYTEKQCHAAAGPSSAHADHEAWLGKMREANMLTAAPDNSTSFRRDRSSASGTGPSRFPIQ